MNKLNKLQPVLSTLYMYSGDEDECCMKHFENGLCILYKGGDPSNQELYVDYSSSGISSEEWDKYEEDDSYEPKDTFRGDLWKEVYDVYQELSEKEREFFWGKVFPYGHITSSRWLHYYK